MNPPFSVPGAKTAYIDHILHGFSFLAPGGVLTTIAPDHFIRHEDQRTGGIGTRNVCIYAGFELAHAVIGKVSAYVKRNGSNCFGTLVDDARTAKRLACRSVTSSN